MTVQTNSTRVPPRPILTLACSKASVPIRLSGYKRLVNASFTAFNSTRLLTYFPTLWAIYSSADSSQHSLLTWFAWVGSNLSMAAWLYEHNGRRLNRAVVVTLGNAGMCVATCLFIVAYRWTG